MTKTIKLSTKQVITKALTGAILGLGLLNGCAHVDQIASSANDAQMVLPNRDAASAEEFGNAVAAWQLEANNDLTFLPNKISQSAYDRGWVKGAFYVGLLRFAETTNNEELLNVIRQVSYDNGFELGERYWHGDDQTVGAIYAPVASRIGDPELLNFVRKDFDRILDEGNTKSLEFVEPKPGEAESGCQRRWCWADAIFMAPPAWALVGEAVGDERYLNHAISESKATLDYLYDPESSLVFRDSRFFDKRTENGKKVFWSRGNGWVFAGLARFIEAIPTDRPEREYFIGVFRDMAETLVERQRADGYWPTSLDDDALFLNPETSGTGFMSFGLAWGLNNGVLEGEKYERSLQAGWKAMKAAVNDEGMLGWVQQIGAAPEATTADSSQIYASGAFLLLAAEMHKMDNGM